MNKYQEALDLKFEKTYIIDLHLEKFPEAQEALYENKEFKEYINKTEEFSNKYNQATAEALQELVDKEKPYTLEEVKKEWEELGYKIHYWNNIFGIQLEKTIYKDNSAYAWHTIYIDVKTKEYYKHNIHLTYINFTLQEHNLLTKTFKALGWYDE